MSRARKNGGNANHGRGPRKPLSYPEHDDCWRESPWRSNLRRRLLDWFRRNARVLPWREQSSPYQVWVSEIMLQQTQVATVVSYYQRFLKSFPTIQSLAEADPQELLSHWEGLGYYRRARSLHAAAKQIMAQHGGEFPSTFDEVIALPGIGRYTAGAILSISKDMRLPILEGNTQRVFSRWIAMRGPATDRAASNLLWELAEEMLPTKNAGEFNQAAMELGALICSPVGPDCDHCPVARYCRARIAGLQEVIPGKVSRVKYEDRTEYAMVVERGGASRRTARYLVRMIPDGGRWAGLWDFPRTTDVVHPSAAAAASGLSDEIGTAIVAGERLATIRHAVTRYRIQLHVHAAAMSDPVRTPPRPWRFVSVKEMEKLPMSVTGRQIVKLLQSDSTA